MDWIDAAKRMLTNDEGRRLHPYRCPAGKITIGVGRNLDDRGITVAEADAMLAQDIADALSAAQRIFGKDFFNSLDAVRQLAIINMLFQLGERGFCNFTNTIELMRARDWKAAASNALKSKWAKQTPKRAARVCFMLETGNLPNFYQ